MKQQAPYHYSSSGKRLSVLEQIEQIKYTLFNENVSALAAGVEPFAGAGVIIAEDLEDVFIRDINSVTTVETPYAQELSWLFYQCRDNLGDVITFFDKEEFYTRLADAANNYKANADDMTGLLVSVFLEATIMTAQTMQIKNQQVKDEVLACVGSLSDVAERM